MKRPDRVDEVIHEHWGKFSDVNIIVNYLGDVENELTRSEKRVTDLKAELNAAPREMLAKDVPEGWQIWTMAQWFNVDGPGTYDVQLSRDGILTGYDNDCTAIARPKPAPVVPDIREELFQVISDSDASPDRIDTGDIINAILERFNVTPKEQS